jgi:tRNA nucleotidyltransferase (CCA-adding enzyme)
MSPNPNFINKWLRSLPPVAARAISGIIATADASGASLYLVGGPVRDLLLGLPTKDIDLVTESDATDLATRAAHYLDARLKTHPTFRTATVLLPSPAHGRGAGSEGSTVTTRIDIATARTETYPHPGALPRVTTPATIEQDLRRRDFTVNAMALRLNGANRGELVDPTGGRADLEARLIRILHDRSFQDDPTRIFRAARYAARLGFGVEKGPLASIERAMSTLTSISGTRLRNELSAILAEPAPELALMQLRRWGALHRIHPALSFSEDRQLMFESLQSLAPQAMSSAGWTLLAWHLSAGEAKALSARLSLTSRQSALVAAAPSMRKFAERLAAAPPARSGLVSLLAPYPLGAVWALAAASDALRNRLLDYLTTARHVRPILRGDDLIALGVSEGPAIGEMLARLRAAKIDGKVKTRTDEINYLRTIYKLGDLKGSADVVGRRARLRGKPRAGQLTRPRRVPRRPVLPPASYLSRLNFPCPLATSAATPSPKTPPPPATSATAPSISASATTTPRAKTAATSGSTRTTSPSNSPATPAWASHLPKRRSRRWVAGTDRAARTCSAAWRWPFTKRSSRLP